MERWITRDGIWNNEIWKLLIFHSYRLRILQKKNKFRFFYKILIFTLILRKKKFLQKNEKIKLKLKKKTVCIIKSKIKNWRLVKLL